MNPTATTYCGDIIKNMGYDITSVGRGFRVREWGILGDKSINNQTISLYVSISEI